MLIKSWVDVGLTVARASAVRWRHASRLNWASGLTDQRRLVVIGIVSEPLISPAPPSEKKNSIEQPAQQIALAKTAVAVLRKRRMIGDAGVKPQSTEME